MSRHPRATPTGSTTNTRGATRLPATLPFTDPVPRGNPTPVRRHTVRLTLECQNRCIFCAQRGLDPTGGAPGELPPAPQHGGEITFVGGEPTLASGLAESIAAARAAGYRRIGLQSNGARLAAPPLVAGLAAAGLTDVHVSVHGAGAEVHDYHTGVPGSFAKLMAAIAACRGHGIEVVATTVLTRSNFRVLGDLPWLLKSRDIAGWTVAVPRAAGAAATAFDRVIPRLGLALPFALHALAAARKLGLPAWIRGAPLCNLGPMSALALPSESRAYAAVCADCGVRERCPGLDSSYLLRFGGDELSPPRAPVAAAEPRHPHIARMFVGEGELAPGRDPEAIPQPPRSLRRRLPVLGKGRPGAREARRSADKKTGAALKELFPSLFEPPERE